MEQVLQDIIRAQLDEEKKLGEQARAMITAACRSDEALAAALAGEAIPSETRSRPQIVDGRHPARRSHDRDQGNGPGLQSRRADNGAGVEGRRRRHGGGGDLEKAPDARGRCDKRFPAEVRDRSSIRSQ